MYRVIGLIAHANHTARCIALNATSLVCGIVGNIFLLCNFTRVVRYIIALPMSIFLWLVSTAIVSMHRIPSDIPLI
jgi:potassium channel subfamily K